MFLFGVKTANPVEAIIFSASQSISAIALKYVLTVETSTSPFCTIRRALEGAF